VQRGAGDEVGADRGGDEEKEGYEQFVEAKSFSAAAEMKGRGDEDPADA